MMMPLKPFRWRTATGSLCLVTGGILTLTGAGVMIAFLKHVQTLEKTTAPMLVYRLIIPHILFLVGLGLLATALVIFTRTAIVSTRRQQQ